MQAIISNKELREKRGKVKEKLVEVCKPLLVENNGNLPNSVLVKLTEEEILVILDALGE